MTINHVNPEQRLNRAIAWLLIGVACLGIVLVYLHNTTSELRLRMRTEAKLIQDLELTNASLKSHRYELLDTNRLVSVAGAQGLIKEVDPSFLSVDYAQTPEHKAQALQY